MELTAKVILLQFSCLSIILLGLGRYFYKFYRKILFILTSFR